MARREEDLGGNNPFVRNGVPFGEASQGRVAAAKIDKEKQNRLDRTGLIGAGIGVIKGAENISSNINQKVITPAINKGSNLLFGDGKDAVDLYPQHSKTNDNPMSYNGLGTALPIQNGPKKILPNLGDIPKNEPASLENPGEYQTYQTANYRDSSITQNNNADSEGDTLGVSLGNSSVSGLTPEQAQRIQASLAKGTQVSGFNMDNMIAAERSGADAKIMEAMRNGTITANKADALMNRDFRASNNIDRLGGNAEQYIKPDQAPTNIKEAAAYGANLNNFTNNGQLSEHEAIIAQRSYLGSLGYFGKYNQANGKQSKQPSFESVKLDSTDSAGNVTQNLYSLNKQTGEYTPYQQGRQQNESYFTDMYNDEAATPRDKLRINKAFRDKYGFEISDYLKGKSK